MADEVVIERRFRGPPASANGGYTCGVIAAALETGTAEVNLRHPPPLDCPLRVEDDEEGVRLLDGDTVVADGESLDAVELELPDPPPFHEAEDADLRSAFYDDHAFPGCFVCGPDRDPGDGLCIYPGHVSAHEMLACIWTPQRELADGDGVRDEIVWAALDCPSGIAAHHYAPDEGAMVLARLRGHVDRPILPAHPHIVVGWSVEREGRKHRSGTAIYDASGEPRAWADALWIELKR
ncbi:MAG: hypothetical protein ACR2G3_04405 [Solirubrobacterales bacterium]